MLPLREYFEYSYDEYVLLGSSLLLPTGSNATGVRVAYGLRTAGATIGQAQICMLITELMTGLELAALAG